jgi:translation initiation factor 5B
MLLDTIRGSNIVSKEAGGITQAIGASIIPLDTIKKKCGTLLESMNLKLTIPGLLFIDTPGHAAFTSLRKRGGSIADIAIVVVDINESIMPQTEEAINILKASKTPFIIAANKIDLISGWKTKDFSNIMQSINSQSQETMNAFETKLYTIVGRLSELGFQSERFDRVQDFTSQLAIVPVSAMTGEGIPSLLVMIAGLAQKYLEKNLHVTQGVGAKGTILEVKEEKGLGKVMDIIIYDGELRREDILVIGGMDGAIVTKVKMLLQPECLSEMRDKKTKYCMCKEVYAATGVRVVAPDIDNVVAGMPVRSCKQIEVPAIKEEVQKEVESALVSTQAEGIVIKTDTIGSLEALTFLLKEKNIPIMKASIGNITKKDVLDAESNFGKNPENCVILGFNIQDNSGICSPAVKVILNNIIYKILDDYDYYQQHFKEEQQKKELEGMTYPARIEILKGYVFRQSNPAIFGVHVQEGKMKSGMPLMKDGKMIGYVKSIGKENETVNEAAKDMQVAVSVDGLTIGRQINEGDILYSSITENEYRKFKDLKKLIKDKEIDVLKEIALIMRRNNPLWGV